MFNRRVQSCAQCRKVLDKTGFDRFGDGSLWDHVCKDCRAEAFRVETERIEREHAAKVAEEDAARVRAQMEREEATQRDAEVNFRRAEAERFEKERRDATYERAAIVYERYILVRYGFSEPLGTLRPVHDASLVVMRMSAIVAEFARELEAGQRATTTTDAVASTTTIAAGIGTFASLARNVDPLLGLGLAAIALVAEPAGEALNQARAASSAERWTAIVGPLGHEEQWLFFILFANQYPLLAGKWSPVPKVPPEFLKHFEENEPTWQKLIG